MVELGIVDIREIVRTIKKNHDFDFTNYALTSFKYGLEKVMDSNSLSNTESLLEKLNSDKDFFDSFLDNVFVPSTEMFRDPSLWRWLREDFFPKLPARHFDNFKIWIPQNFSGGELYTLCILLKELDIIDKVKIIVSCFSDKSIEYIKSGKYNLKKLELSIENYKRFHGLTSFDTYYKLENNNAIRDNSLIKSVEFIKDDITFSKAPQNVKLILFRNAIIYYNPSLQVKILENMNRSLSAAGSIILGIKENIKNTSSSIFEVQNENESVYKRKI